MKNKFRFLFSLIALLFVLGGPVAQAGPAVTPVPMARSTVYDELHDLKTKRQALAQFAAEDVLFERDRHAAIDAAIAVLKEKLTEEQVVTRYQRGSDFVLGAALSAQGWRDRTHHNGRASRIFHD